jgi:hypothetical protein
VTGRIEALVAAAVVTALVAAVPEALLVRHRAGVVIVGVAPTRRARRRPAAPAVPARLAVAVAVAVTPVDDAGVAVATKPDAAIAVATTTPDAAIAEAKVDAAVVVAAKPDAGTPTSVDTVKPTQTSDKLEIKSKPAGARVFIDGADQGTTPVKLAGSADRHTMVLLAPGYDLYYLNALSGTGRSMAATDDPAFAWVRKTWNRPQRSVR